MEFIDKIVINIIDIVNMTSIINVSYLHISNEVISSKIPAWMTINYATEKPILLFCYTAEQNNNQLTEKITSNFHEQRTHYKSSKRPIKNWAMPTQLFLCGYKWKS